MSATAYLDLNPIRACMGNRPELSDYTGIKERITPSFDLAEVVKQQIAQEFDLPPQLMAKLEGSGNDTDQTGILFSFDDYLTLANYSELCVR